jgi:hypothetical protein
MLGERAFCVDWGPLKLIANPGDEAIAVEVPAGRKIWSNGAAGDPWTVTWLIQT